MQQMDGAELVLGDAVRTPEVIGNRAQRRIFLFGVASILKYIVDFFLRENAIHLNIYRELRDASLLSTRVEWAIGRIRWVRSFHVQNFGCRASQADGAALEAGLVAQGLSPASSAREAGVVVLNSCTVTASADEDVRKAVHRVHRENPAARILVTGCYAQRAPQELAVLPGVYWVVGNSHKTQIPEIVAEPGAPYHGEIRVGDIFAQHQFLSAPVEDASGDRTRPNLKIQDGCNNRCSFCIIPFVRGRSRSAPAEQVIEQVRNLSRRYREVVLSGINLGRWGREPGSRMRIAGLIRLL